MDLQKNVEDLRSQGLTDEQILQAFEKMLSEEKITSEDLEKVKQLLSKTDENSLSENDEKAEASKLFGLKLI